jgi:hypothetical protein
MSVRKSSQIPAIASLSSPQFDANPFLPPELAQFVPELQIGGTSGNVP